MCGSPWEWMGPWQTHRAVSSKAAQLVLDHGLQLGLGGCCNALSGLFYVGCHLAVHQGHMAVSAG